MNDLLISLGQKSFPSPFHSVSILFTTPRLHDLTNISTVLSHPNDNGKDFAFKIGESSWSQVCGRHVTEALKVELCFTGR